MTDESKEPVDTHIVNAEPIPLLIVDKAALYSAYMPFVKNGGIFVRTTQQYRIGDRVMLSLQIFDPRDRYMVKATVVWITPPGAQAGRQPGIGVQFDPETPKEVRNKIETYLVGSMQSDRRTDTM